MKQDLDTLSTRSVKLIRDGVALVDSGPLFATVLVSKNGQPMSKEAVCGANYALEILQELASFLPVIKQKVSLLHNENFYPPVVREMINAVGCLNDPDFTPLAAVAGTTADMVADYLMSSDATKIIVNNGGDIAIRLKDGDSAMVGLCLDINRRTIDYFVSVTEDCGICTSGVGGRSFSLGVASAAVTISRFASVADASATYLGNKTNVNSSKIIRRLSEEIYPDTDIPGMYVTIHVGNLSQGEIETALANGKREALKLMEAEIIQGATISLKGENVCLGKLSEIKHYA